MVNGVLTDNVIICVCVCMHVDFFFLSCRLFLLIILEEITVCFKI